jgi:hypothetical protein
MVGSGTSTKAAAATMAQAIAAHQLWPQVARRPAPPLVRGSVPPVVDPPAAPSNIPASDGDGDADADAAEGRGESLCEPLAVTGAAVAVNVPLALAGTRDAEGVPVAEVVRLLVTVPVLDGDLLVLGVAVGVGDAAGVPDGEEGTTALELQGGGSYRNGRCDGLE